MAGWEACEKLLKSRHFNLVDVIDAHRRGKNETVQTFASAEALKAHTKKTAAFFPRYHVAAGSLLKCVLRRLPATKSADTPKEQPIGNNLRRDIRKGTKAALTQLDFKDLGNVHVGQVQSTIGINH